MTVTIKDESRPMNTGMESTPVKATALDVLREFCQDVQCAGPEKLEEEWPDLHVTYGHAQEVLREAGREVRLCPRLLRACALTIGFCVNARQTWPDWKNHPEVGLLYSQVKALISGPNGGE